MSKGSLLPFFIFLATLVFFLLGRRKKKEETASIQRPRVVRQAPTPKPNVPPKPQIIKKVERPRVAYEVEKKKTSSFLHKKWQDKDVLKQAFILSEVLKKTEERNLF